MEKYEDELKENTAWTILKKAANELTHEKTNLLKIKDIPIEHIDNVKFYEYTHINIYGQRACGKTTLAKRVVFNLLKNLNNPDTIVMVKSAFFKDEYTFGVPCNEENLTKYKFHTKIIIVDEYEYSLSNYVELKKIVLEYGFKHIITISQFYEAPYIYMSSITIVFKEPDEQYRTKICLKYKNLSTLYDIDNILINIGDLQFAIITENNVMLVNNKKAL